MRAAFTFEAAGQGKLLQRNRGAKSHRPFSLQSIKNFPAAKASHDYSALRMDKAPVIETHIINSLEHWGGAGEPATPGIAPALANAIYAASGIRVRELPVSRYELGPAGA